jgi:hypothetical protein
MSQIRLMILIIVVTAGLVACSGNASEEAGSSSPLMEEYTFRSIDEIVDGELVVTNFADGTASLPLQTSVPVACSIVYGTTPEFGSLSTDLDMQGGAHSSHNPLLTGLEPETEYFYRVQGVDDNGTVYLSEIMTFTTPDSGASAGNEGATDNLASPAMGAEVIDYSSAFGDAGVNERWGAGNAFDGNPSTEWSTAGDGDEAWVEVKLARRAQIEGIDFQTRAMGDGSAIALAFTVTTDSGETFGPFEVPDANRSFSFDLETEAETLRFDLVETTGGNTGVVDIAVRGEFVDG